MSTPDLEAIRKRTEAATGGPWERGKTMFSRGNMVAANGQIVTGWAEGSHPNAANAEFIAHSREDIPTLLNHITELTATITALRVAGSIPPTETSAR